jgi:hypothetical protein
VTGADLKQKVEAIMLNRAPQRLDIPRKILLIFTDRNTPMKISLAIQRAFRIP